MQEKMEEIVRIPAQSPWLPSPVSQARRLGRKQIGRVSPENTDKLFIDAEHQKMLARLPPVSAPSEAPGTSPEIDSESHAQPDLRYFWTLQ